MLTLTLGVIHTALVCVSVCECACACVVCRSLLQTADCVSVSKVIVKGLSVVKFCVEIQKNFELGLVGRLQEKRKIEDVSLILCLTRLMSLLTRYWLLVLQVGKAMSSNETAAYAIMRTLDVDYVLVIFGGVIGYSGDDINKFLWMVRIAEGEHPKDIRVRDVTLPVRAGTSGGHFRFLLGRSG